MENIKTKKIKTVMLSGGGTGGSVTPLLAVAAELLKDEADINLLFVGAKNGPEKELVSEFHNKEIRFLCLPSGKLRRYFSGSNFFDIFKIIAAFFKSLIILNREKPDVVISAGSFISVPLVWAAACRRTPILIHQQDVRPGLANKLMAPFARVITVTFEKSLTDYGPRAVLTGNPTKDISVYQSRGVSTRKKYNLKLDIPFVFVVGGGTGALAINELIAEALPDLLPYCQIINLTGHDKAPAATSIKNLDNNTFQAFEFVDYDNFLGLLSAADLVVSRCGLGVLTEISALAKAAILIPMPDSHQEDNAALFKDSGAAIVLNQKGLTAKELGDKIKILLGDPKLRGGLIHNVSKIMKPEAAQNMAALIFEMIKK